MRYNKKIYLVQEGEAIYDEETGNYIEGEPRKKEIMALVTDTGTERMNLLCGGINQHAKTIRINQIYDEVDHIEMDNKKYQIDVKRSYRHKMTFEVSGV